MPPTKAEQMSLFPPEGTNSTPSPSKLISLEFGSSNIELIKSLQRESPALPARWEAAYLAAENKQVLPILLHQIRPVPALDYLKYLISLSQDEGYAWTVYGAPGSGKSAFFHTLEYQTNNQIRVHIIDGNSIGDILHNHFQLSKYLEQIILEHKSKNGYATPLVMVLEERENNMSTEERSSLSQALRNVLRPPKPGTNVIFVLPVTNSGLGDLFIKQAAETGVAIPGGHNTIYSFQRPPYTEHVDILNGLF